ncbi:dimethyl sulfoxide reductase anchor subunit [Escherichia coli]|nr:dimethyl sulfoxide reductase anchor subunit [Escherichia coli]
MHELPLVFFTVLMQAVAGSFILLWLIKLIPCRSATNLRPTIFTGNILSLAAVSTGGARRVNTFRPTIKSPKRTLWPKTSFSHEPRDRHGAHFLVCLA